MIKNNFLKILALITVSTLILTGCSSNNSKNNENKESNNDTLITLILDKGGVNDSSFNQSSWAGALNASKDFNVDVRYLESSTDSDYYQNIETAIDMNSSLIIGIGFNLSEAIESAALNYPEQQFAIVDGVFDKIPSNVTPIIFDESEAGYLAALATAKTIKSDKYGFIGGFEVPAIVNYIDGFRKGLLEVNPNANLSVQYANSFTDAAKGRAIAEQMINKDNASCIVSSAGGVNIGIYEACSENGKYAIAVDMSQSHLAPDTILTSAIKKVDVGVYDTIKDLVENNLKGGTTKTYNIANNGVDYEKTPLLSEETIQYLDSIKNSKRN